MGGGGRGGKGPTTVSYGTKEHNGTFPIKVFFTSRNKSGGIGP